MCGRESGLKPAEVIFTGIIESIDRERGTFGLYAPAFDADHVASIQFGSLKLDTSGQEIV